MNHDVRLQEVLPEAGVINDGSVLRQGRPLLGQIVMSQRSGAENGASSFAHAKTEIFFGFRVVLNRARVERKDSAHYTFTQDFRSLHFEDSSTPFERENAGTIVTK